MRPEAVKPSDDPSGRRDPDDQARFPPTTNELVQKSLDARFRPKVNESRVTSSRAANLPSTTPPLLLYDPNDRTLKVFQGWIDPADAGRVGVG